jgi:hypothetical protein
MGACRLAAFELKEETMMDTLGSHIGSRAEFAAALCHVLDEANTNGTRELWLVDPDFSIWPLDDLALLERLTHFARAPQRCINLLAHDFDDVPRRQPRFSAWRRTWSHVVHSRAVEVDASEVPTLLLAGVGLGVLLLDRRYCRGRWFRDDGTWRTWREVVDALSQRSETSFGATTLGL